MPFLAPLIPAVIGGIGALGGAGTGAALARAGIGLGTGLLGSKLGGGVGGANPQLNPYESGAMANLQSLMGQLGQYGPQFMSRAEQAYGPAQSYWSRLLAGNRPAVMGALGPEIEALTGQQQQVRQIQGELQPRGGPGAAFMAQLPYQTAGQIGALMSQARGGAATSLGQLAGTAGQLGLGAFREQQGAASGILDTVLRQKCLDLYRRQQEFDRARSIGKGIYGLLGGLPGGGTPSGEPPLSPKEFPGTGVPTGTPFPGATPPFLPGGTGIPPLGGFPW